MSSGGVPVSSIAPLSRRLVTSVLDGAIILGGIGGVVAAGWWTSRRLPALKRWSGSERVSSRLTAWARSGGDRTAWPRSGADRTAWARSGGDGKPPLPVDTAMARWTLALRVTSLAGAVMARNWRGPGGRIMQVRQVDARTGGPVTVRSALIGVAFTEGWRRAAPRLFAQQRSRAQQRLDELQPALKELQHTYRGDPDALNQALSDFYRAHQVNPLRSCLWQLPGLALPQLPALWSARSQTAGEWLSGTVVVHQK